MATGAGRQKQKEEEERERSQIRSGGGPVKDITDGCTVYIWKTTSEQNETNDKVK